MVVSSPEVFPAPLSSSAFTPRGGHCTEKSNLPGAQVSISCVRQIVQLMRLLMLFFDHFESADGTGGAPSPGRCAGERRDGRANAVQRSLRRGSCPDLGAGRGFKADWRSCCRNCLLYTSDAA